MLWFSSFERLLSEPYTCRFCVDVHWPEYNLSWIMCYLWFVNCHIAWSRIICLVRYSVLCEVGSAHRFFRIIICNLDNWCALFIARDVDLWRVNWFGLWYVIMHSHKNVFSNTLYILFYDLLLNIKVNYLIFFIVCLFFTITHESTVNYNIHNTFFHPWDIRFTTSNW